MGLPLETMSKNPKKNSMANILLGPARQEGPFPQNEEKIQFQVFNVVHFLGEKNPIF
jgi:hypothetical protein